MLKFKVHGRYSQSACLNRFLFLINNVPSVPFSPKTYIHYQSNLNLLKTVSVTRDLRPGKAVHARLIRSHQHDVIQTNHLINLYVKCDKLQTARRVFDLMPDRNVVSISALMGGYLHKGFPSDVLSLFTSMASGENLLLPNEYIFTTVLSACSDLEAVHEGRQCHAYVLKSGIEAYSHVSNALLHMYSKCSGMDDALELYKNLSECDIFSHNIILKAILENGYLSDAVTVMKSMVHEVGRWDQITYITGLGLSANLKDLSLGCQLHSQVVKRGLQDGIYSGSAIVDMYGKCNDVASARHAFDRLTTRNVVSWTALMAVCALNGCFEEALKLFSEMLTYVVHPNELSYAVALNACAGLSSLRNGEALNALVEKSGHKEFLNVGNALINMYSKCGSIEEAHKIFEVMHERDIISWNSIITGFSHHGLGREALQAFHAMIKEGVSTNYVTFVGVLSACGHLGLVADGFNYLNFMEEKGISPGLEHRTCIVVILCRAGLLDDAEKYMRCTHIDWDIVAWRSLLSGCRVHRNFQLAKRVAQQILHIDPDDVGTYILLSNIHAKERCWDGVVAVRKLMKGRCIKKEPGVSWIEVRNETHVFASDDNRHQMMGQIREKLVALIDRIKLIGYAPDVASVLHDVGDEQREEYLAYHSEKLAVAFGLIATSPGATIRIMKNLRVCNDCHSALKLISIVAERKIVVRDANRFHCFKNGVCSCHDYW